MKSSLANEKRKIRIQIPEPEEVFNRDFLPLITDEPATHKPLSVIEGGRGSGKSRAIAQRYVLQALKKKLRFGLVRKVFDTIRHSQYQEIRDVVDEWGLGQYFEFLTSPLEIRVTNGSQFICKGLDKAEKTKSLAALDGVWIEEATELTQDDWDTFRFSIRGESTLGLKQKILSFNRTAGNWTEKAFFNADESFRENPEIYHLHTTYLSNRFLDGAFLRDIEATRDSDPELYRKVAEGRPVRLSGLIFTNWRTVDEFPENCKEVIYGLDFGVSDPTVLCRLGINERNIFVDELLYQRGLTNQDLLGLLPELCPAHSEEIYADSADANRIEEIFRAGWNIKPSEKGRNSVVEGIAAVKNFTLHITARSTNIRKDFENYKWKVDNLGHPISPEAPMHAFSHGPDAVRYPIFTHLSWGTPLSSGDSRKVSIAPLELSNIYGY